MKLVTFTAVAMLLSAGYAFAGGGAPVPPEPEGGPPAGRPGAARLFGLKQAATV